ncbi:MULTISPECIES: FAD-binding protein [Bacillus]|uniref:FAD-binding protein n=1 Tax=Bacillus TaxID=1386 RepID=UPI0002D378FF|nr:MULTISPECIES: FAD-binding protein [Bacillus]
MYDVVIVGQGLSGLLSAIWAREEGKRVAVVSNGLGKILQSTGVFDLIPGTDADFDSFSTFHGLNTNFKTHSINGIEKFKTLVRRLDCDYLGKVTHPVEIATASGHVKTTALYPDTIRPVPMKGRAIVVGFKELMDFQPSYLKGNLQKYRPDLKINAISVSLGKNTLRTMTQIDVARTLEQKDVRQHVINQIKNTLIEKNMANADFMIFPSCLGIDLWKDVKNHFQNELKTIVSEAPGLPPNAAAIRLYEKLRKEAVKLGVRFYADTKVVGCTVSNNLINSLEVQNVNAKNQIQASHYVIATGGVLGGGLVVTTNGYKESALALPVNEFGEYKDMPANAIAVGGSQGIRVTNNGIVGGIYSIVSSYFSILSIRDFVGEEQIVCTVN